MRAVGIVFFSLRQLRALVFCGTKVVYATMSPKNSSSPAEFLRQGFQRCQTLIPHAAGGLFLRLAPQRVGVLQELGAFRRQTYHARAVILPGPRREPSPFAH